ncbi:hypothetical protein A2631_01360 [Candidatus Daviesbacteria bacterium RIFCSPHIGHO2_01_FULL_44_29]|uniref:Peptidase M50 domain-containing protein n=1 Tax=Candidatus Daviesbacteria bacterium RIFCSPHIGHO2_02_FULL_43_12 TaxID=1797776 RepID=A0A1F5KL32_9BACT|nr:MAG: hypothetical protein A2631_01360 [Candidatus Daviesbacteria bacterium RIFCSPHIGHO2_01_FULL_44_29]OGE39680.1 MAG: hypothetical protein A3E86_00060 [Candidatus Daviesbacteria bacterium RIFCSPHIGHO2_12_FULL_47_45]OGE41539.1 MAG: hypothetical protein A3D25_00780 [Candidatus Daviesbacteria bacterium RIFCSPHIGHO2_02_FULL_43_12]OGE69821.1 MAG: hypothetical protein A3B55_05425 [Candidatus Daviesbacteria bacterium RIFCSPLOWO2_01_FULL_43_15]
MPELLAFSIVILLFSVILHEVAHGLAARYFGDYTAEDAGRLTLNPLPHIDPIGTILLPLLTIMSGSRILFGWAKPVPVNPLNFSDIRRGELIVSLAGVGANFGVAILGSIIWHILQLFPVQQFWFVLLGQAINLNLTLTIFNLLPIPPLDGSKVLMSQLPYKHARTLMQYERYGPFILLGLLFLNFGGVSVIDLVLGFFVPLLRTILFLG